MKALGLAVLFLGAAACGQRALPGGDGDLGADAGAGSDLAAVDLAGFAVGVRCGAASCDTSQGRFCCETPMPSCTTTPCDPGNQTVACDGPEDCGGRICCLLIDPFGSFCESTCGQSGVQRGLICHTRVDCGPGQICCPLEVSGGLSGCVDGTPNPSCT